MRKPTESSSQAFSRSGRPWESRIKVVLWNGEKRGAVFHLLECGFLSSARNARGSMVRWCTKPQMEVVEKTRRLRYTCRFTTPSYISRRFTALFYTRYARVRRNAAAGREGSSPRARLTKGNDINEGIKKEEKKVKEQELFTCTRC